MYESWCRTKPPEILLCRWILIFWIDIQLNLSILKHLTKIKLNLNIAFAHNVIEDSSITQTYLPTYLSYEKFFNTFFECLT